LDERPEGDPVAVVEAAPCEDHRVVAQRRAQLCREARLADACWTDDGEQPTGPLGDRLVECGAEVLELRLASDQRRVQASTVRARALDHRQDVPSGMPITLPLH